MSPPLLVCLDFDGVLADTENVHVAAWERTFGQMGWDIPADVCVRAAEQDDYDFLRDVIAGQAVEDADIEGWVLRKRVLTCRLLSDAPVMYPGVNDLVDALADRNVPIGIVSSAWLDHIEAVLLACGLLDRFQFIVSKEDVPARKPAPDAYKLALLRMNLAPSYAVALEDSPGGLQAARAAGVRGVAVGHRRRAGPWTEEAFYIPDFRDIEAVLHVLGFARKPDRER